MKRVLHTMNISLTKTRQCGVEDPLYETYVHGVEDPLYEVVANVKPSTLNPKALNP